MSMRKEFFIKLRRMVINEQENVQEIFFLQDGGQGTGVDPEVLDWKEEMEDALESIDEEIQSEEDKEKGSGDE